MEGMTKVVQRYCGVVYVCATLSVKARSQNLDGAGDGGFFRFTWQVQ